MTPAVDATDPIVVTRAFRLTAREYWRGVLTPRATRRFLVGTGVGAAIFVTGLLVMPEHRLTCGALLAVTVLLPFGLLRPRSLGQTRDWRFFADGRFEVRSSGLYRGHLRAVKEWTSDPRHGLVFTTGAGVLVLPARALPDGAQSWIESMVDWAKANGAEAASSYTAYTSDPLSTLPYGSEVRASAGTYVILTLALLVPIGISIASDSVVEVVDELAPLFLLLIALGGLWAFLRARAARAPRTATTRITPATLVTIIGGQESQIPYGRISHVDARAGAITMKLSGRVAVIPSHAFRDEDHRAIFVAALRDAVAASG